VHTVNLWVGWLAILVGLLAGAGIGLFFHDETWLGGYASWRRRMLRLAHVALVGTGLLNIAFGLLPARGGSSPFGPRCASVLFAAGAVAMPLACLLSAWRKEMRHLFFIPVSILVVAALLTCLLWPPF
jgi:hypothetical protein